jgi:hypothetical protein
MSFRLLSRVAARRAPPANGRRSYVIAANAFGEEFVAERQKVKEHVGRRRSISFCLGSGL